MAKYQVIIGRSEYVDFVGVSLGVPAKIDTGAFRSAVHATNIKEVTDKDGNTVLRFNLFGHKCAPIKRPVEVSRYDKLAIKSSNGKVENRYEVTLKIKVGPKVFNTSFTLANRKNTVFPVLIGRKALSGRFVVDTAKSSIKRQKLLQDFGFTGPISEEDTED